MTTEPRTWASPRLTGLLDLDYPIVQGPFGGGFSSVRLAAAVADAGGLGSFGAHALSPTQITALVAELRASTRRAFAVNLWVPQAGEADVDPGEVELARHVDRLRPAFDELGLPVPPDHVAVRAFRLR